MTLIKALPESTRIQLRVAMNCNHHAGAMLVLTLWAGPMLSCNSASSSGSASFSGRAPAVTTTDEVVETYTKETTKPEAEVTVQGVRKVKFDNLCKILIKNSDNTPVGLKPSVWRTTRGFLISHSSEMNYFCSKYANLGELFDAVNLDPKSIHKTDIKTSIAAIADIMNGGDVSSGPKKMLSTTPLGACDNIIKPSGGGGDTRTTKAATAGMSACAPGLTIGVLLLNGEGSSLNNNLTAAAVACLALYANLLKKNSIELPQASQVGPSKECKAAADRASSAAAEADAAGGGGEE